MATWGAASPGRWSPRVSGGASPPPVSTSTRAGESDESDGAAADALWEGTLSVRLKQHDREWVTEQLCAHVGVCPAAPRHGAGREVGVRLTNPRDAFFLYSVRMSEDDYGRFKEDNSLSVDFNGFPRMVVSLLQECSKRREAGERQGRYAELLIDSGGRGRLRVMEVNNFRHVEMLGLDVVKENDAGQKKYLAERGARLEGELRRVQEEKQRMEERLSAQVDRLQRECGALSDERDSLLQRLQQEVTDLRHSGEIGQRQLRESKERELREQQLAFQAERKELEGKHERTVTSLQQRLDERESECARLAGELRESQQSASQLRAQLDAAQEQLAAAQREAAQRRARAAELEEQVMQQQRTLTENTLRLQRLEQEGQHKDEAIRSGGDKARLLQQHCEQLQQQHAHVAAQLKEADEARKAKEQELQKAHHVIQALHSKLETSKQRRQQQAAQLAAKDQLIAEKDVSADRMRVESQGMKGEIDNLKDKVRALSQQCADLTSRLEEQNSRLIESEDLVKCYQKQVRFPSRLGVTDTVTQLSAAVASGSLQREFGRHAGATSAAAQRPVSLPPSEGTQGSPPRTEEVRGQAPPPQALPMRSGGLIATLAHEKLGTEARLSAQAGALRVGELRAERSNFFPSTIRATTTAA
eukprot:TRINITY_DN55140_c0_g1_i1.p1 TRINITY_DN55140_c0_g1~~TRINITY_DN55140_c0_g1_i1.p1  ORF type:complete len:679 (+),score=294.10 TRINITY_DN55140_c0_g1_i1:103-2037(+)